MDKNVATMENLLNAEMRAELAGRVEVLDRVKKLLLLPKLDMMTVQQVADYYEVERDSIKRCYQRNKTEIDTDGTLVKFKSDLKEHFVPLSYENNVTTFDIGDGVILKVPNRGVRMFSKRAILRIGMLLRDSRVAREVRTQLLNTFEHATEEQRTQEILSEQEMYINLGKAFATGSKEDILLAGKEIIDYQNRYIQALENSNKVLAAEILAWSDRASLNKAIRYIASASGAGFAAVWSELYQELLYKHGIGLKMRGDAPYIRHIREDEWGKVQQSLAAICEKHALDIQKVVEVSKLQEKGA